MARTRLQQILQNRERLLGARVSDQLDDVVQVFVDRKVEGGLAAEIAEEEGGRLGLEEEADCGGVFALHGDVEGLEHVISEGNVSMG